MRTIGYDIPVHDIPPQDLSDKELLEETVCVTRMLYFVNSDKQRDRITMRNHYGALLCNGELQPLINEIYHRVDAGESEECRVFLEAAKPILLRYGGGRETVEGNEAAFLSAWEMLMPDPTINAYYRRLDPEQPVRIVGRGMAGAKVQAWEKKL